MAGPSRGAGVAVGRRHVGSRLVLDRLQLGVRQLP